MPQISPDQIDLNTATLIGRSTAGFGSATEITLASGLQFSGDVLGINSTAATALMNSFTSSLKGLAPASGGGTANFLRADGTWATPPNTGVWGSITGTLSSQTDLATALSGKEPSITSGSTSQYWRGDKSFQTLDKTVVGLSNVDNTSDASKPVSTAQQTALDLKANLASPTFTGTITAAALTFGTGLTTAPVIGIGTIGTVWPTIAGNNSSVMEITEVLNGLTSNTRVGIQTTLEATGSATSVNLYGNSINVKYSGSGSISALIGNNTNATLNANVTAGSVQAFRARVLLATGLTSGVITAATNFQARTPVIGSGSITTSYGFYSQAQKATGVTTGYGIYQAGATDLNAFEGNLATAASTTTNAGFTLPHGAAPTAPVNGDLWSTTTGLFTRINGTTKTLAFIDSNITGSSSSLTTGRTIAITGDLSYTSPAFDGSGNVTAAGTLATVNSNTGSFGSTSAVPIITVNGKGLVTAVSTAALGTAATKNTGTSGNTVPLLDGINTWSAAQTFNGQITGTGMSQIAESIRAGRALNGGGTITFDSSGYFGWSTRFVIMSNGRGAHFSTSGYFDITQPTTGTITGVGGASNKTATSAGIPLAAWEALYYILPIGSSSSTLTANFRVVSYTSDLEIPESWVLLALYNGDSSKLFCPMIPVGLSTGQSFNGNLTATTLASGRTISITGDLAYTSPSFDGSGNVTAAGTLATVNSNTGSFGSTTAVPIITVNGKGLITAVGTATLGSAAVANTGTSGATIPLLNAANTWSAAQTFAGSNISQTINSAPTRTGTITDAALAGVIGVTVSGKYAYVGSSSYGSVSIVDIANPASPTMVGTVQDYTNLNAPFGLALSGKYLYVACNGANKVSVVDVSNPHSPSIVTTLTDATNLITPRGLAVVGSYAYVCATGANRLTILDISNPTGGIFVVSSLQDNTYLAGADGLVISGKYAYIAAKDANLISIVDISDPASPTLVGHSTTDVTNTSNVHELALVGKNLFAVSQNSNSITCFDVSNPASPTRISTLSDGTNIYGAKHVYVAGNYAYLTSNSGNRLTVVDISNTASMTVVGSYQDNTNLSQARGIFVSGKYAIVGMNTGVTVMSLTGIEAPVASIGNVNAHTIVTIGNAEIGGNIFANGGLNVGGGIKTDGRLSANYATIANDLNVIGVMNATGGGQVNQGFGVSGGLGADYADFGGDVTVGGTLAFIAPTTASVLGFDPGTGSPSAPANYSLWATTSGLSFRLSGVDKTLAFTDSNITGSAAKWTTGRTLSLTGDIAYTSPSFDGSGNVTAAATLATVNSNTGSFGSTSAVPIITVNGKGLITAVSTATLGTAAVANTGTSGANVPLLNGTNTWSAAQTFSSTISASNFSGSSSGTNTGDQTTITGNAGTATSLATGRTIAITGDLAYTSPSFDGSGNVTAAGTLATVNSNTGSFGSTSVIPVITVNGKGLITAVSTASLGTAAVANTGTSGANLPFLNAANTWSATQTFTGGDLAQTPSAPVRLGFVNNTAFGGAIGIAVSGKYAFVASSSNSGIASIDISVPSAPAMVGSLADVFTMSGAFGIAVSGRYAFVTANNSNILTAVDISNPKSMSVISSLTDATNIPNPRGIQVVGKYAYVAAGTRITIVDISNPASMVVTGSVSNSTYLNGTDSVFVSGKYLYTCARTNNSIAIVDISNPSSPSLVGYTTNDTTHIGNVHDLHVVGRYLYCVAQSTHSIAVYDVSDPTTPTFVSYLADSTNLSSPKHIYVAGSYAYVTDNSNSRLTIVDISNPSSLTVVTTLQDTTYLSQARGLFIAGKYVYVAANNYVTVLGISGFSAVTGTFGSVNTQNIVAISNAEIGGNIYANGGINVGGNIRTDGVLSANSLAVNSTSVVTNLNADLLDGQDGTYYLNAGNLASGTVAAARLPALTGDITTSVGTVSTTLATVNSNTGSFGSTSVIPVITVNGKGLVTAVSTASLGAASIAAMSSSWVVGKSAVAVPLTGSTSETTLATIAIPANAMGPNGQIEIYLMGSAAANNANVKTFRVKFGGTTYATTTVTGALSTRANIQFGNRNATNSQVGFGTLNGAVTSTVAPVTSTVDTTSSVNIDFTGQLANSSDTMTLELYMVRVTYGA